MNLADLNEFVSVKWDEDLVPQLVDYVRVPAKSPADTCMRCLSLRTPSKEF